MNEVTTYVGIDAHKKDLFIAMLTVNAVAEVIMAKNLARNLVYYAQLLKKNPLTPSRR